MKPKFQSKTDAAITPLSNSHSSDVVLKLRSTACNNPRIPGHMSFNMLVFHI